MGSPVGTSVAQNCLAGNPISFGGNVLGGEIEDAFRPNNRRGSQDLPPPLTGKSRGRTRYAHQQGKVIRDRECVTENERRNGVAICDQHKKECAGHGVDDKATKYRPGPKRLLERRLALPETARVFHQTRMLRVVRGEIHRPRTSRLTRGGVKTGSLGQNTKIPANKWWARLVRIVRGFSRRRRRGRLGAGSHARPP